MLTSLIVTSSINASNIHLQTSAALAELSSLMDMKMNFQQNTESILTGLQRE